MKTKSVRLLLAQIVLLSALAAHARTFSLVVNNSTNSGQVVYSNTVEIAANEVATIRDAIHECSGATSPCGAAARLRIVKEGTLFDLAADRVAGHVIGGPAKLTLFTQGGYGSSFALVTVNIEPESFPPGQTLILPAGTVGVVHAQSSTNLIEWRDEWVHTFTNTNENRFFRLSAERSTP